MRKIYSAFLTVFLLFCASSYLFAQSEDDNKGKEFWIMFNLQFEGSPNLDLFITSETATSGTVEIPGFPDQDFTVTPGEITTIDVPSSAYATASDGVEDKGIRISAAEEVTVYGLNQANATTDAFLALPVDILSTEYYVMSFTNRSAGLESLLGVVATEDDTEVTITPASNAGARAIGIPYSITLNKGQTYQLRATGSNSNDLTGTSVVSTKPVAVFGGHVCADVPKTAQACDHLIEQMPPASSFGQKFVTVPLATRRGGDLFRILASEDGTKVSVEGTGGFSLSFTLNKGEFEEIDVPSDVYTEINANDGSVLVAQFSKGTTTDGVTSDPFMLLIPPFEQFQDSYTVTTPATIFDINFINLAVPTSAIGNITLDGNVIPDSDFTPIGNSDFSATQQAVERGTHTMTSGGLGLRFGAFMYGFAQADSYGYPGGQAIGDIVGISEVTLELEPVIKQGDQYCFSAVVTKEDGTPSVGAIIDFVVSGANNVTGNATTDENGRAEFCYTPENPGTDNIRASIGNISDETTVTVEFPTPSSLVLDPETITVEEGVEVCITGTVFDQFGDPLEGVEIFTEVDGEAVGSGTSDENGEVEYCFTPTESGLFTVVCFYEGGDRVTAEVTVLDDGEPTLFPDNLILDPETITVQAGVEVCIVGTVFDQFGNPLEGVEIFTEIDGEIVGSGISDENGKVEYCFTPTESGLITVVCFYEGGERVTAEVTVLVPTLTISTSVMNSEVTVVCTVLDQFDNPFPGETITIEVSGANSYSDSGQTDVQGVITFVYQVNNKGTDIITCSYSQGEVSETITIGGNGGVSDSEITNFTLVNAETDQDIQPLDDGDVVYSDGMTLLDIRANTNPGQVGSVRLELSGPLERSQLENLQFYSLFGDNPRGDYNGAVLPSGEYTLTATPYSERNEGGDKGQSLTIKFEIINISVDDFTLVNAKTDQDIQPLQDGNVIDLSTVGEVRLDVRAGTTPNNLGSVQFKLDGPVSTDRFENLVFYSLFGDNPRGDYQGEILLPGQYTLTAIPYSERNGNGFEGASLTIQFEVVGVPSFSVESFTLVNSETDQDISPLNDGGVIDLAVLGDIMLSARATTSPGFIGSVIMELDGPIVHQQLENRLPYSLFGDNPPGEYSGKLFPPGSYTLTATPYSAMSGQGFTGTPLTIEFDVVDGSSSRVATNSKIAHESFSELSFSGTTNQEFIVYPIPSTGEVNIVVPEYINDSAKLLVYDAVGKLVHSSNYEDNMKSINLRPYGVGVYFVRLLGDNHAFSKRILIK